MLTYDPAQASSYPQNQVVFYNGDLYVVGETGPAGIPGTAGSGYTQLTNSSRIGRGVGGIVQDYNPVDAASYRPGQLVTFLGKLYQVLRADPYGDPEDSFDYRNLSGTGSV
ncbi:MAG: hypothetical protein LBR72_09260, partial [Oscillospiraceae bacterium]|nr:hypothetical protein [Oscillospiraceae bacterium]